MSERENRLRVALKDLLACFDEHLAQEAHEANVSLGELCPCHENEAQEARVLLAELEAA